MSHLRNGSIQPGSNQDLEILLAFWCGEQLSAGVAANGTMIPRPTNIHRHLDRNKDHKLDAAEVGETVLKRLDTNQDQRIDHNELWEAFDRMEPAIRGSRSLQRIDAALSALDTAVDDPWRLQMSQDEAREKLENKAFNYTLGIGGALTLGASLLSGPLGALFFCLSCLALWLVPAAAGMIASDRNPPDLDALRGELRAALGEASKPGPQSPAKWLSEER